MASQNATRIYYGTDTRAASILLGAALGAFLRGLVASVLSVTPFVGLGVISYGLYLWHGPI